MICSNANSMLPNASLSDFGLISSKMDMAWVAAVCGRLESRFRYSNSIVYNNFPFPLSIAEKAKLEIENAALGVLKEREEEEARCAIAKVTSSLAAMYADGNMPEQLAKAHLRLDRAVDKAYGYSGGGDDAARVAYLFRLYEEQTSLLPVSATKRARKQKP